MLNLSDPSARSHSHLVCNGFGVLAGKAGIAAQSLRKLL